MLHLSAAMSMPVSGPFQSVQRAEFWSAISALQAFWLGHLGSDDLNVVKSIGRLSDHGSLSKPLPLVKDRDLIAMFRHMIRFRGRETVQVTKVKGHATDADVEQGRVREEDKFGNAEADTAAVLGRRLQSEEAMDVGRALLNALEFWYPIVLQLHRFTVALSRVRVGVDLAMLLGPPGFLHGP